MTITRDSVVLWLGIVGGVLTALAAQADMFPATWKPWITMVATIIAVVSGKLATSPLASVTTPLADKRPALGGFLSLTDKE
jgi:type IV secretory pathway VirB2 component (pilin)